MLYSIATMFRPHGWFGALCFALTATLPTYVLGSQVLCSQSVQPARRRGVVYPIPQTPTKHNDFQTSLPSPSSSPRFMTQNPEHYNGSVSQFYFHIPPQNGTVV
ncbi:hypothetical protein FS749_000329 [Ceratobasidium sp. UAMH 11750]|nr:hypothetical protein FS749_000329 [Ceratobasidium sp. UAMH 11750]